MRTSGTEFPATALGLTLTEILRVIRFFRSPGAGPPGSVRGVRETSAWAHPPLLWPAGLPSISSPGVVAQAHDCSLTAVFSSSPDDSYERKVRGQES